jgi:hypothetical protein
MFITDIHFKKYYILSTSQNAEDHLFCMGVKKWSHTLREEHKLHCLKTKCS